MYSDVHEHLVYMFIFMFLFMLINMDIGIVPDFVSTETECLD